MKRNQEGDRRRKALTRVPHSAVSPDKQESGISYVQDSLSKNAFPMMGLLDRSSSRQYPNLEKASIHFFEQRLNQGNYSQSPPVLEKIEDMTYNIFENCFDPPVAEDLINFDLAFKDDDSLAMDDVFRLEV
jgi:hypothetical protein